MIVNGVKYNWTVIIELICENKRTKNFLLKNLKILKDKKTFCTLAGLHQLKRNESQTVSRNIPENQVSKLPGC